MGTWILGPPGRYLSGISPHGEVFLLLLLHLHRTACGRFSLRCVFFFLDWKCFCDFWYTADPESSAHESPAPSTCTNTSPAGLLSTLVASCHSRISRWGVTSCRQVRRGDCYGASGATVHHNQSAASVIDCDSCDLVYLTCHCSYNRVKGCNVANVSQCTKTTAITYDSQSHTVATHCLIGWLWKVRVLFLKISFKIYKHFQSFQTKYNFWKRTHLTVTFSPTWSNSAQFTIPAPDCHLTWRMALVWLK